MHVCCCDRAGSGEPEFLFGPETERAEGGCSRYEEDSGKLTGLRAWNFYLPRPPSRHHHVFISRHLNTYKEVHGNVYGNATATLPTIPLSFGALWSILSEARRGSFPPLPSVILSDLLCSRTSRYVVQDGIIAALCSAMPLEALIISCARR